MVKKFINVPAEAIASRHIYKILRHFPVKVIDKNILQFDISDLADEAVSVVRDTLGGVPYDIIREETICSVTRYRHNGDSVRCGWARKEPILSILKDDSLNPEVKLQRISALVVEGAGEDLAGYMESDPWFAQLNGLFKMVDGQRL